MAVQSNGRFQLDPTKASVLPLGPVQYERKYQDELNNILRLYFQSNDNVNGALLGISGGKYLSTPSGSFISTTTQNAAVINTAYSVTLSALTGTANSDVFIGAATANSFPSSRVYAPNLGVYNLQVSLQFENTDAADQDVSIWVQKNGANQENSNSLLAVPSAHGAVDGHVVAIRSFFLEYTAADDYFEIVWATDSTTVSIPALVAAAPAPVTPSVILTMHFVSRL